MNEWMSDAACIGADPELFFPEARAGIIAVRKAKVICAGCSVRESCLDYALTHRIDFGVWGGLTVRQRRVEARIRRRRVA